MYKIVDRLSLFLQESNQIEGYFYGLDKYKNYLLTGKRESNKHIKNSVKALDYVFGNYYKPLTLERVLELHKLQMKNLLPIWAGKLRECLVSVGGHVCPPASHVGYYLNEWIDEFNKGKLDHLDIHGWFEKIHPFVDGNGRTGRLLWAWYCLKQGTYIHNILSFFNPEPEDFYTPDKFYPARSKYYSWLSGLDINKDFRGDKLK